MDTADKRGREGGRAGRTLRRGAVPTGEDHALRRRGQRYKKEGGREGGRDVLRETCILPITHLPLPSTSSPPPNMEHQISAAHKNGKFDLSSSSSSALSSSSSRTTVPLFLGSAILGLGAGLRRGAKVRVWNVHPICLGGQVQVRREGGREGG